VTTQPANPLAYQGPGDGQPQGPEASPQAQPVEQQPQGNAPAGEVLTPAQLAALLEENNKKLISTMQSMVAKSENRISKKALEKITALESAWQTQASLGQPVDPAVQEQVKQKIILDDLANSGKAPPEQPAEAPGQGQGQAQQQAGPANWVAVEAQRLVTDVGGLTDDDPEAELVKTNAPTALDFLKSVEAAAAAKRERLASQNNPQTRMPSTAGGTAPTVYQPGKGSQLLDEWCRENPVPHSIRSKK
jgi:hypothetical protein